MKHYLGIDWGEKRIGLAYADDSLGIAFPLPAMIIQHVHDIWEPLISLIMAKKITHCVIGLPLNMDDSIGPQAQRVIAFGETLKSKIDIEIAFCDERLTSASIQAHQKKHRSLKKKIHQRQSGTVDSQSAALILQDYLNEMMIPKHDV